MSSPSPTACRRTCSAELGRYQAIEIAYAEARNGGKLPDQPVGGHRDHPAVHLAECHTYKTQPVHVSPQFGTMNYTQDSVVAAPDTLSRAEGPPPGRHLRAIAVVLTGPGGPAEPDRPTGPGAPSPGPARGPESAS